MITSKQLLELGWHSRYVGIGYHWTHPKLSLRCYIKGKEVIVNHTLAQARWAQEHILDKEK